MTMRFAEHTFLPTGSAMQPAPAGWQTAFTPPRSASAFSIHRLPPHPIRGLQDVPALCLPDGGLHCALQQLSCWCRSGRQDGRALATHAAHTAAYPVGYHRLALCGYWVATTKRKRRTPVHTIPLTTCPGSPLAPARTPPRPHLPAPTGRLGTGALPTLAPRGIPRLQRGFACRSRPRKDFAAPAPRGRDASAMLQQFNAWQKLPPPGTDGTVPAVLYRPHTAGEPRRTPFAALP